jgi:ribosome-binding protein aMBF1 (putative translation factor)
MTSVTNVRSESFESTTDSISQVSSDLVTTSTAPPAAPALYLAWVNVPSQPSPIESEFQDIDDVVKSDEQDSVRRQHLENARKKIAERLRGETAGIAALRLQKGWSQQRLAKEIGTSQPHIARIESGQDMLLDTARRLANALSVSLQEIDEAARARMTK